MNGVVEALHIYDEHNTLVLSHTYSSRPVSAAHLLPLYLEHPVPRPNLVYLPNTNPPTLVFSLTHANLLFLLTTSSEVEPLLVLEFLHRAVDALEEFLGAPLLAHKIEASYDVVAQLLTEMCDAGAISTTEPNALRDLVEVEGFMDKLLGNLNLPTKPAFASSSTPALHAQPTPALPWRRANVRHTSNELYADVIETLSVTLAPSGRPLAALASGTIAFTSKVSGVPDLLLTLTGPAGKHNLKNVIELPVFHPCVRLARWREQPGVLSFIPPDGRFTLAGYEVDLMPFTGEGAVAGLGANPLKLPVTLEIKTGLGVTGSDFEVRVQVNRVFGPAGGGQGGRGGGGLAGGGGGGGARGFGVGVPHAGTPGSPALQDLTVSVPLPADVRNLSEIRPTRGDANYNPGDRALEWSISNKELAQGTASFALRCTVVGQMAEEDEESDPTGFGFGTGASAYSYDEPYQSASPVTKSAKKAVDAGGGDRDERRAAQNKILMPSSASVSFAVKGWLASGIKVESIQLDPRKSRGLGESVKPYKGVKYLTVSKGGVEIRC
ncbi:Adaptor complexes medium subunit family-domain-containing protein [Parachaetomium inaequale]|uniref:Adaptor complexes medium subunit family-domain-containing protein n=1 Tax=Parachaetomium inaequale TaxID=2588326 RepID=A0AAN6PKD4_9PEZI|nr:Adaptor complexes medium subunit family-domain-containing protein [Parachaetomium inaequale]